MHLPPLQCELQLAIPPQWLWHSPEVQAVSQLALPLQVCEQSASLQFCVQSLELVHVTLQSPPSEQVS
jgi:hypothetical protein